MSCVKFPELKLPTDDGKWLDIPKCFEGRWTLLYFYPKDATPGCTRQAILFSEHKEKLANMGVQVLGVSADSVESHKIFKSQFDLRLTLVADSSLTLSKALGVYGTHSVKGVNYTGLSRDIFLINPQIEIVMCWRQVEPGQSVDLVINWMKLER